MFLALILVLLSPVLIIADDTDNPSCTSQKRSLSDTIENAEPVDQTPSDLRVTKYDGPPLYLLSEDEKKQIANGTFVRPEAMPIIQLEPGVILDFDGGNLTKRDITRQINVYGNYGCYSLSYLAGAKNFGCGTGCFSWPGGVFAHSVWLKKSIDGNPSPTASMFGGTDCSSIFSPSQSVGIESGLRFACTNAHCDNPTGWGSFIAYYNC